MSGNAHNSVWERGFALLAVLWATVLLSVLVTLITASGRIDLQLATNLRSAASAEAAADGAIFQTLFHLLATGEQHWPNSGMHRITIAQADVQVGIENLAGRVNPNTATPELMRELLEALGVDWPRAVALSQAVVDWRTPERPSGLQGSQRPDYGAAGRTYVPPGIAFGNISELGGVLGMTPDLLAQLRPHLTLWWENDPDPNFADPVVMMAMQALGDTRPRTGNAESPFQVVSIVATATNSRGGRFVRHVDAIVNSFAPRLLWRILAWDSQGF